VVTIIPAFAGIGVSKRIEGTGKEDVAANWRRREGVEPSALRQAGPHGFEDGEEHRAPSFSLGARRSCSPVGSAARLEVGGGEFVGPPARRRQRLGRGAPVDVTEGAWQIAPDEFHGTTVDLQTRPADVAAPEEFTRFYRGGVVAW